MKINSANRYRTPWQRTGQKTRMRSSEKCRLVTYWTLAPLVFGSPQNYASARQKSRAALIYSPALPRHRRVKI